MSDIHKRSYDCLVSRDDDAVTDCAKALTPAEREALTGHQKELCMVGDSVTWAEEGDWFRRHLLTLMPELAFIGTHSSMLGFAHAGEGADSTFDVQKRVNDPERIPDATYYHLLIGINDCSCAGNFGDADVVAADTFPRIVELVRALLRRKGTEKVFLGSILPSPFDPATGASTPRDLAGSRTNEFLRKNVEQLFPDGNVVWIEYEKPLRAMGDAWKALLHGAHPSALGYRYLAELAAPVLKREMREMSCAPEGVATGVKVENLWIPQAQESRPLIPGWYILSFRAEGADEVEFTLYSTGTPEKGRFERTYRLPVTADHRVEVEFMTGYEFFGYTRAPFRLTMKTGSGGDIQIEKMRPLRRASRYGEGVFVDTETPVAAGEKLFRVF